MPPELSVMFRYFWLLIVAVVAANLLYGWKRAAALVTAGLVTQEQVDAFVRNTAIIVAGLCSLLGLLQLAGSTPNPVCLMMFPPPTMAAGILWLAQALLSMGVVWWLWARDGARILALLAPAFTRGPVLERKFSPGHVRLLLTAIVVVGPIGNIAMQLAEPTLLANCSAV